MVAALFLDKVSMQRDIPRVQLLSLSVSCPVSEELRV